MEFALFNPRLVFRAVPGHGKSSISMKYLCSFSCRSSSLSTTYSIDHICILHICPIPCKIRLLPMVCGSRCVNVCTIASQLCRYLSVSINVDACMYACAYVCMRVACLYYNSTNNNSGNKDNGKFAAIGIFYALTVFCCMLLGVAF